jgi:hypothetical protein
LKADLRTAHLDLLADPDAGAAVREVTAERAALPGIRPAVMAMEGNARPARDGRSGA